MIQALYGGKRDTQSPKLEKRIRTLIWKHGIVQNWVDLQIRLRTAVAEVVYELSC